MEIVINVTEESLNGAGSYDDVPTDTWLEATLVGARTIDKTKSGTTGVSWEFDVQGLSFSTATWNTPKAEWKTLKLAGALGEEISPGTMRLRPEKLYGRTCLVKIGYDENSSRPELKTIVNFKAGEPREALETLQESLF